MITGSKNTGLVNGAASADSVNNYAGGLVGYITYTQASNPKSLTVTISDCSNENIVTGYTAGGIVGGAVSQTNKNIITKIESSYNVGNIAAQNGAGGIIGQTGNYIDLDVVDCYNIGDVTVATSGAGGLIGIISAGYYNNYKVTTDFTNCYNIGTVTGTSKIGGINGEYSTSYTTCTYINTYYLDSCVTSGAASGSTASAITGITSKDQTAFEYGEVAYLLQAAQTETDENNNIIHVWGQLISTDKYPVLAGAKVYEITNCRGDVAYSNTDKDGDHIWINADCNTPKTCFYCGEIDGEALGHNWVDGVCSRCNAVENEVYQVHSYDIDTNSAIVAAPEAGTYIVIFTDYNNQSLANVEIAEITVTSDNINKIITVPNTQAFSLGKGDKVMLWSDLENLAPKCNALEITE